MNFFVWPNLLLNDRAFFVFWYRNRFLINIFKVFLSNRSSNFTVSQSFHESLSIPSTLVIDIW